MNIQYCELLARGCFGRNQAKYSWDWLAERPNDALANCKIGLITKFPKGLKIFCTQSRDLVVKHSQIITG